MSFRPKLIVTLGIAAVLATAAQPVSARSRKDKDAAQPFIVETRIAAPKRVGEFELESTYYDPATKHAGASFRYALPDHPQIRFDLFVYPAGDMPQNTAMTSGMKDFLDSFDAGVKMKYYNDLKIVDTVGFDITPNAEGPAPDGTKPAAPGDAMNETEARRAAALAAAIEPKPISGKRIALQYDMRMDGTGETVPMRSRGYLFYKQLYYFKGRVSVAESLMDQATYDTLSDRAMRALVPAISASNIGSCASTEIVIDKESAKMSGGTIGDLLMQIVGESLDGIHRNCHESRADAKASEPKQAEIITIEYDPDDWGSR